MNYIKQLFTVTLWEFGRFFKPKNEAIGIIVMLGVSIVSYFGSKYAFSDKNPQIQVFIHNDTVGALSDFLKQTFLVQQITIHQKDKLIGELSSEERVAVIEVKDDAFKLHAYKTSRDIKKLKAHIDEYYRQVRLQSMGINGQEFSSLLSSAPIEESFVFTNNSRNRVILAFFLAGLMIMAVFLSFAYQFTAITGEKQLKITEQIVSAISPQVWMDGKILGITLTGLSSMLTYSLLSVIGGVLYFQVKGLPVSEILHYIHFPSLALYLPFALTGVLIWNAILAAVAAVITDPNNSGKSSLMLLPVLFVVASFLVIRDPDSGLSLFLSWFPLTSATSMPMRWAISEVGIWQLVGSFFLLLFTFYILRKIAAKIFRVTILLTGKEPTWNEVFKLIKMT